MEAVRGTNCCTELLETGCANDSTASTGLPPPPWTSSVHWGLLTLSIIPVWIVAGNSLVLLALLLQRHLQNMSNRVIASLAVTDFLLALVVVPLSIYQLVKAPCSLLVFLTFIYFIFTLVTPFAGEPTIDYAIQRWVRSSLRVVSGRQNCHATKQH